MEFRFKIVHIFPDFAFFIIFTLFWTTFLNCNPTYISLYKICLNVLDWFLVICKVPSFILVLNHLWRIRGSQDIRNFRKKYICQKCTFCINSEIFSPYKSGTGSTNNRYSLVTSSQGGNQTGPDNQPCCLVFSVLS